MDCSEIRTAISAGLDGEAPGLPPAVVDEHLARCAACRHFADAAGSLHRRTRLAPAEAVPDLSPAILAAIGAETRDRTTEQSLRWSLVLVAVVQLALAVPDLLGTATGLSVHAAHHIGSFDVALAVGFVYAAWRPDRAAGLVPVVAALTLCLVGTSIVDIMAGNTAAVGETQHITDFAGLAMIWFLSRHAAGRVSSTGDVAARS
jgi:predicted anti-sigma-YlaC factor YlaD